MANQDQQQQQQAPVQGKGALSSSFPRTAEGLAALDAAIASAGYAAVAEAHGVTVAAVKKHRVRFPAELKQPRQQQQETPVQGATAEAVDETLARARVPRDLAPPKTWQEIREQLEAEWKEELRLEELERRPSIAVGYDENAGGEEPEAPTEFHPARRFLEQYGKDPDKSWFRTVARGKGNPTRSGRDLRGLNAATLTADNKAGGAVYFVTGDADHATGINKKGRQTGCVSDPDITCCRAVFVEWDDRPIEWQLKAWQELNLPEPSLMVRTGGKSIHCYWLLTNPMEPNQWRVLQERLITYAGGDQACKNPSRVMRLPGFYYIDKETGLVTDQMAELGNLWTTSAQGGRLVSICP